MIGQGARSAYIAGAAQAAGFELLHPTGGKPPADLTDQELDSRIAHLHVLLAGANDELQRRGRTKSQRQRAQLQAWLDTMSECSRSLDPSDE